MLFLKKLLCSVFCLFFLSHCQIFYHFHQILDSLKGELQNNIALWFFLKKYLLIYLAAPGLSCGMRDLVPWPGIKPRPPASGAWRLIHRTTRKSLHCDFYGVFCVFLTHPQNSSRRVWRRTDRTELFGESVVWAHHVFMNPEGFLMLDFPWADWRVCRGVEREAAGPEHRPGSCWEWSVGEPPMMGEGLLPLTHTLIALVLGIQRGHGGPSPAVMQMSSWDVPTEPPRTDWWMAGQRHATRHTARPRAFSLRLERAQRDGTVLTLSLQMRPRHRAVRGCRWALCVLGGQLLLHCFSWLAGRPTARERQRAGKWLALSEAGRVVPARHSSGCVYKQVLFCLVDSGPNVGTW